MNLGSGRELFLSFLALGPVLVAQAPRRPRGIYAVVHVETYVNQQQQANPSITQAQLDAFFNGYCQDLRNNPAISGITLQMGWKSLNPNPPTSSAPMTASGLPDFSQNFTIPNGYAAFCPMPTMHCAAATTVLSHFVEPAVGGANAKEAMTGGWKRRA